MLHHIQCIHTHQSLFTGLGEYYCVKKLFSTFFDTIWSCTKYDTFPQVMPLESVGAECGENVEMWDSKEMNLPDFCRLLLI